MLADVLFKVEGQPDRPLKFGEKAKLLLLGSACRAAAGILPVSSVASGSAGPGPVLAAPAAASVVMRKIKLSLILKQGDDTDVTVVPENVMTAGYARWEALFGLTKRPAADADVTIEQLSCVKHLIDIDAVPYTDYSIWGPHGHRMERALKFRGHVLSANSTFRIAEMNGPASLEVWLSSYDVMSTAFVMLDILDLGTLVDYRKKISDYHGRYGPDCWMLLYQADTRFRMEHLERTRRLTVAKHELALLGGSTTLYDAAKPWKQSWVDGMADKEWWADEFVEPAMLFLTRTARLNQFLGGDAPISGSASSSGPQEAAAPNPNKRSAPPTMVYPEGSNKRMIAAPPRVQPGATIVNGLYTTNRSGTPLCGPFQTGACGNALRDGMCPADRSSSHQCQRCLGNNHGLNNCPYSSMPLSNKSKRSHLGSSKGGGKGKGKGGGKKGKGRRQW